MDWNNPKPAPEPLALVQDFVNTRNHLYGGDKLADAEEANAWLVERGLLEGDKRVGEESLRRLADFREELRGLLLAHNGGPEPHAGAIDELVARVSLSIAFGPDGRPSLLPAAEGEPEDRVLGRLLAVMVGAEAEGTWARLKTCRNEDCRWIFYDASKNHSGRWCNMDVCGARHKMRAYRERRSS
jgi:predicted RNA-binding Zn ribbon-like protein